MPKIIEYKKDDKIGECIFVQEEPPRRFLCGRVRRVAIFECDCGNHFLCLLDSVKYGKTTSCGCKYHGNNGMNATHGHTRKGKPSSEFVAWQGMLARCGHYNKSMNSSYTRRGIIVCDRWLNSFGNFLEDMGERPSKEFSLDRIDNDLGYYKENCRWATREEQNRNKSSNHKITFNGETLCKIDWASRLGIDFSSLTYRIENWPLEKALTEIPRHLKKIING